MFILQFRLLLNRLLHIQIEVSMDLLFNVVARIPTHVGSCWIKVCIAPLYKINVKSPTITDFTSHIPKVMDFLMSVQIRNDGGNTNTCRDFFGNDLDSWLNSDQLAIYDYISSITLTPFFNNANSIIITNYDNVPLLYDRHSLQKFDNNTNALTENVINIYQKSSSVFNPFHYHC